MSLVAIAAALRAQCKKNPSQRAWRVLGSGLGLEARAEGVWWLWRIGVEPSDREVSTFARDAKLETGFSIKVNPWKDAIYRQLTPLEDAPDAATHEVCPSCRVRSLIRAGGSLRCPDCGHGGPDPAPDVPLMLEDEEPLEDTELESDTVDADWNRLEGSDVRGDLRPGLRSSG
ncbi:MAG: hypothetical protein HC933_06335 [Pleurocapsa sp. SU_196_0]|nr:hypothetical protein [Pleurocapsa sp. SU_196_0]